MAERRSLLEKYSKLLSETIMKYQDPVSGLLPAFVFKDGTAGWARDHAWVRDNVYSILAAWGMSLAYRRRADGEEDNMMAYQLEQNVVKLMRSLLFCMMRQADKVERFKHTLDKGDSLHAKYNLKTCSTVVGDFEWGHLQIDATSLYLLVLAQMTAAGLKIVYTLDEVAFVQNLVFYIEEAYRIPDYGIWERGDKSNHGETELNASSIGMAKAALEAIGGLDLFGARGGEESVIHVMQDEVAQCYTKLKSLLPRESSSKEVDAALLNVIGFPAFAVENMDIISATKDKILNNLLGKYGCRRFLRDGYQTAKEDPNRLHYEPAELKVFQNIECEWPMFLLCLLINAHIEGNIVEVKKYEEMAMEVVVTGRDGVMRMPELYKVPASKVELEYGNPHSQARVAGSKVLHMRSQSLLILSGLLQSDLLAIGEIDPLNRRFSMLPKPDPLVQVVLLAEDAQLSASLRRKGITSDTIGRVERNHHCPVKILPAKRLTGVYQHLGVSKKMKLSGRPPHMVGVIGTSQVYNAHGVIVAFTPNFLDHEAFYLCLDNHLLVDLIKTDIAYLKANWRLMGQPTIVLPVLRTMLSEDSDKSPFLRLLQTLTSGYTSGARVQVGLLPDFISTSCVTKLNFISSKVFEIHLTSHGHSLRASRILHRESFIHRTGSDKRPAGKVYGAVRRSRHTPPNVRRKINPRSGSNLLLGGSFESSGGESPMADLNYLHLASAYTNRRRSIVGGSSQLQNDHVHSSPTAGGATGGPSSSSSSGGVSMRDSFTSSSKEEVVERLQSEDNLYNQADILTYLFNTYGKDFSFELNGQTVTVTSVLEELYQKAGYYGQWSLVRHTAGMLKKRVEDLGPAATDLLVRQKHFSLGQPGNEIHITQPLASSLLMDKICEACGNDHTAVALTQEILIYLAMFIRIEQELFQEMLRLRIGLIYNVMVTELARSLSCSNEDAVERLLELGPYDLKSLLHHIFSRKEFRIDKLPESDLSLELGMRQLSIVAPSKWQQAQRMQQDVLALGGKDVCVVGTEEADDRHGQWQRRRRLDGALNRVPRDFYKSVWHILERCPGIAIGNQYLPQSPTVQEMTPGELKFALRVESVLNSLPDPDYRQLVVEVLMVFSLVVQASSLQSLGNSYLVVEHVISQALHLFLQEQKSSSGPAVLCCCEHVGSCGGAAGVCIHFYDCAPSGRYGTMSYFAEAVADRLRGVLRPSDHCKIS